MNLRIISTTIATLSLFSLFCLIFLLQGCTSIRFPHKTVTPEEFGRMYTKQSVVSDFDAFMRSVEEAHPNPYLYTPKGAIQSLRDSLVSRLPDSLQRIPAVLALKRLASAYQDGHLSVSADEEYEQFLEQDGRIFPFGVKLTSNGLAVTNSYTSTATVRISDVILRINGFAADSLVREFAKEQSGERAFHRQQRALNSIATNLWMHNIRAPYTLVYRPKSGTNVGTEQTSIVVGITNKERKTVQQQSQQTSSNEASSRFYSFSMLPDGIGLMRWRTMYDDKVKFAIFLNQIFSTLANDSTTKGLIIDVRDNRGGDSRYGVDMIDYLTDKPYKSGGGKVWKASRQYREFVDGLYAQIPWTIRWLPFHWFIPTLAQLRTHAQRPDGTMYV
ncbi:MAG: S41 family peptidase, partial [Candidatus Kapaibacteriota bacterium]